MFPATGYDALSITQDLRQLLQHLEEGSWAAAARDATVVAEKMERLIDFPKPAYVGHQPCLPAVDKGLDVGKCASLWQMFGSSKAS